jgi:di/tricarboxylate transporter
VLAIYRGETSITENISKVELQQGDSLLLHSRWDDLALLDKDKDFIVISDYPQPEEEDLRPDKAKYSLIFFAIAVGLVLIAETRLSVAFMVGATGMILTGVLRIDEAYRAVDWRTVFLLAGLIPLGIAVDHSQTAAWIAQHVVAAVGGMPDWVLLLVIAVLATGFSLVMSNVGATVLLVPLAVNIAIQANGDPRIFALVVGLATSNSFLLPTHQVNALIMGAAGYRNRDFLRAGGVMSILFLTVLMLMLTLFY